MKWQQQLFVQTLESKFGIPRYTLSAKISIGEIRIDKLSKNIILLIKKPWLTFLISCPWF